VKIKIKFLIITNILFCLLNCSKKIENIEQNMASDNSILNYIDINYDYGNGNGTIIERFVENNKKITIRKYETILELYSVTEGLRANERNILELFEEPNLNSNVLSRIPFDPTITQVNTILLRIEESFDKEIINSWLYVITDNDETGWLYLGISHDPYQNGNWAILEKIEIQNQIWTIRKLDGSLLLADEGIDIKNNPGIYASDLFKLSEGSYSEVLLKILAITEERDNIDGSSDHWIKIEDEQNRIGWIFGGYTYVNRGGPQYRIPDVEISFRFDFP